MATRKRKPTPACAARLRRAGTASNKAGTPFSAAGLAGQGTALTLDRRRGGDRRKLPDRRKSVQPVALERRKLQRRAKVNRRRQIDPTTCERDYTPEEIEFMRAMDAYKRSSGRMFPTCSEVLEVLRSLGYEKRAAGLPAEQPVTAATPADSPAPEASSTAPGALG